MGTRVKIKFFLKKNFLSILYYDIVEELENYREFQRRCKTRPLRSELGYCFEASAADSNGILGKRATDGAEAIPEKSRGRCGIILLNIAKSFCYPKTLLLRRNQKQMSPKDLAFTGIK